MQLAEAGITGQADPDHQGIDKEADQLIEPGRAPRGTGRAEHDVVAAAVPGDQRLEGREQHHVQGGARTCAESLKLGQRDVVKRKADRRAPVAQFRRTRTIRPQVKQGRSAAQVPGPGREARFQPPAAQVLALPERVVGVLHRQAGSRPGVRVRIEQLALKDVERPAVAGDVVEGQREPVLIGRDPVQARPQHRVFAQVEGPPGSR